MFNKVNDSLKNPNIDNLNENFEIMELIENELNIYSKHDKSKYDVINDEVIKLILNDINLVYEQLVSKKGIDFKKFILFLQSLNEEQCNELKDMSYENFIQNEVAIETEIIKKFSLFQLQSNNSNYVYYSLQISTFYSNLPHYAYRYLFFKEFIWTLISKVKDI